MATETTNYKFIKDEPNEFYDVAKVNANLDKIDAAIEGALDKANQAFQSASDGKTAIANSITAKGVPASKEDTFPALASKIDSIETDKTGDATAVPGDILKSKTAYAKGNKLTGTLELTGNALLEHVLASNTFYNNDAKVKRTGTMPNIGALNQTITTNNGQINIASGYYSGGVIKAIFANLVAGNIKEGVNIGGVVGNFTGSDNYPIYKCSIIATTSDGGGNKQYRIDFGESFGNSDLNNMYPAMVTMLQSSSAGTTNNRQDVTTYAQQSGHVLKIVAVGRGYLLFQTDRSGGIALTISFSTKSVDSCAVSTGLQGTTLVPYNKGYNSLRLN